MGTTRAGETIAAEMNATDGDSDLASSKQNAGEILFVILIMKRRRFTVKMWDSMGLFQVADGAVYSRKYKQSVLTSDINSLNLTSAHGLIEKLASERLQGNIVQVFI